MYIEVNGVTLYYEVSGNGPAILLVHGNGEDHSIFNETAELLRETYTVYALDSRDHGKSSRVKTLGYEAMAEDVAEFVRKLKLENPCYCGFSDGGIIGILAAVRYPELFSKLVLCGANAYPQGLKWYWLKLFALLETVNHDPKLLMMLKEPQITVKELESIPVPVLLLAGEGHGSYIIHSRKLYYYMKKFLERPIPGEE